MNVYCTERFREEYLKLLGKKSYRDLPKVIFEHFHGKNIKDVTNGVFLNNNNHRPFIKKRLKGSGGYRVYFLSLIVMDKIYLTFIHPKTGSLGSPNLKKEVMGNLLSETLDAIEFESVINVFFDSDSNSIRFEEGAEK